MPQEAANLPQATSASPEGKDRRFASKQASECPVVSIRYHSNRTVLNELIAGRYRVQYELGRGGMGVVYAVEHVHTGEVLALKLLHASAAKNPEAVLRFKREARAAAKIRSDHVVRVTDADTAPELDGAPFLVMERLEGIDLESLSKQLGPLQPEAVVALLMQAARALDKAHKLQIVHRDLKPENLFLHRGDSGPIVKVLDFGISKFSSTELESSALLVTTDGALLGTPYYMSPEQATGRASAISQASDLWALGLIALRLLMADHYWRAQNLTELLWQISVGPLDPPSVRWNTSPALDDWFRRACDRDPARRFGSASEQVEALGLALGTRAGFDAQRTLNEVLERSGSEHSAHAAVARPVSATLRTPSANTPAPAGSTLEPIPISTTASGAVESGRPPSAKRARRSVAWVVGAVAASAVAALLFVFARSKPSSTPPPASAAVSADALPTPSQPALASAVAKAPPSDSAEPKAPPSDSAVPEVMPVPTPAPAPSATASVASPPKPATVTTRPRPKPKKPADDPLAP
ncbi:MAG: protein kinase [Polyangiaceae bacterium]